MSNQALFNIVLINPEIPGNTGSIGRTCVALGLKLHLIHPLGFDLGEKAVKRAGLDYWKYVDLEEHQSWEAFLSSQKPANLILYSRFSQERAYYEAPYTEGAYLVFGSETKGIPEVIVKDYKDRCLPSPPTLSTSDLSISLMLLQRQAMKHYGILNLRARK